MFSKTGFLMFVLGVGYYVAYFFLPSFKEFSFTTLTSSGSNGWVSAIPVVLIFLGLVLLWWGSVHMRVMRPNGTYYTTRKNPNYR